METKTNYTYVGLMVVFLTAALIAGGLWLSVGFNQKKYTVYATYFHEPVSGLSLDSPVKYNGVQVGSVLKINLSHIDPQEVQILLNIVEDTPITTSTYATLISQGITGTTFIGLNATTPDLTPLRKIPNERYPIIPTKPSLFKQLDTVLKEVSDNVNSVSVKLKEIFDNDNIKSVKKTLENLETFTDVLTNNNDSINKSLKNTDILIANMAKASKDFPQVIQDLENSVKQLSKEVSAAGQSVTQTMTAGKTTITRFNEQALPPAISLLRKLNNIAANLEKVSAEVRRNPSVVIRGTTPPKPGPGE